MKIIEYFPAVLVLLLLSSCATETEDCICTDEFRVITVLIINETGSPVEGLQTTVRDEKGKSYNPEEGTLYAGYYSIMTDKYVTDFTTDSKKIYFTASSDSMNVNGEYFINTDRCRCHINKISGPDTLVIK
ncbi:MAG TPA: hypothetical protein VKD08_04455 [Ignavibacteriaceae bacterium]|nr:hypothetical protein [Ignavibacteriaceae bacterium]